MIGAKFDARGCFANGRECGWRGGAGDDLDWPGAGMVWRAEVAVADGCVGVVYPGNLRALHAGVQPGAGFSRPEGLQAGSGKDAVSVPDSDDVPSPSAGDETCGDFAGAAYR